MKRGHKRDPFETDVLSFLERRKGKVIDDALLSDFASYFWRKKVAFELNAMRRMVKQ